jgi:tRNA pseudouridine32 synthase / 23S rRNA pseudouridine746 synthase
LHAAARCVVVEKPAWLLSVPGRGEEKRDSVAVRVAEMFPGATGPLVVHRLDMETSGLMVLALDAAAQRELSMQFERRMVEKGYVALLGARAGAGTELPVLEDEGVIELPMRLDVENRPRQIVDLVQGRPALTRWQVLAREADQVRIRFVPVTGRTHQLRIHAAAGLGMPMIGDALYGGRAAARLMLHATYLSFVEPGGGRVEFESKAGF